MRQVSTAKKRKNPTNHFTTDKKIGGLRSFSFSRWTFAVCWTVYSILWEVPAFCILSAELIASLLWGIDVADCKIRAPLCSQISLVSPKCRKWARRRLNYDRREIWRASLFRDEFMHVFLCEILRTGNPDSVPTRVGEGATGQQLTNTKSYLTFEVVGPACQNIAGNHHIRGQKKIAFSYSDPGGTLEKIKQPKTLI